MVFSSPVFLFVFLPIVLALHFALGRRLRNFVLMLASLLFYAWGEPAMVLVMILSIVANYAFGLWLESQRARPEASFSPRAVLTLSVIFNLGLLAFFKYTNWIWDSVNALLVHFDAGALPAIPAIRL
ncbi:MAG: MBOAT family protein, partial [Planctomycetota bacterium]